MTFAGTFGVPRRHWDITFTDAYLSFDYPATAFLMLGLNGLSAILAAVGGIDPRKGRRPAPGPRVCGGGLGGVADPPPGHPEVGGAHRALRPPRRAAPGG